MQFTTLPHDIPVQQFFFRIAYFWNFFLNGRTHKIEDLFKIYLKELINSNKSFVCIICYRKKCVKS